jgi:hypothetical protein
MSVLGWRLRTVATAAAASALFVVVAACGEDGEAAVDGTTTSTSDTTIASTTTTQDPEAEVEAAYLAYWEMFKRLVQKPNPDDPEIDDRVEDAARDDLVDALTTLQAAGEAYTFGPKDSVRVLSVDVEADMAVVRSCAVADASLVKDLAEPERQEISTSLFEADLAYQGRAWLVRSVREVRSWAGSKDCSE